MGNKNILLLTENWPPRLGGIENYLCHIASYLSRAGYGVTVVAPKTEGRIITQTAPLDTNFQVIRRTFFRRFIKPSWLLLYFFLKRRAHDKPWDLTLCGKGLFEGLIGYLLQKKFGIPYVVFTYAMEISTWNDSFWQRKKLKKVLHSAAYVVYINEVTKQKLLDLGVTSQQLLSIQPGVDESFLRDVTPDHIAQVLKKYGLHQPYILSVGRLIKRKGFSELIDAFSHLEQTKFSKYLLVIVGSGPELNHLQTQAKEDFLDTSVILLPDVPNEDLPALYSGASIFALTPKEMPQDIEGFGIVYLEAAACAIPALATRTGGTVEAVIDGKTGIVVEPNDTSAITSTMNALLSNNDLRKNLGQRARQRIIEEFTWDKKIQALTNSLAKISTITKTKPPP